MSSVSSIAAMAASPVWMCSVGNDGAGVGLKSSCGTTKFKSILSDVTSLIKLVDSKDIVELELKHKEYEIVIKKAEAMAPQASASPTFAMMTPPSYPYMPSYGPPPPSAASAPSAPVAPAAAAAPADATPALPVAPQYPPMLSPMAGTFYRCPGPAEAPFVQVGDKVSKGQVLCIIEAMKLLNEIECEKSGTIVEILVEDGKPVSADTPLFVIKP